VVNLLDQKLATPTPDYLSYTLSKAALQSASVMLAQALAPRLRVCGVAPGVTMISGDMSEADFAAAHRLTPLLRSSTPADVAGRALPDRGAGGDRHHAAGRRRPAPGGAATRRGLPRPAFRNLNRCKACSTTPA
jgi:NAD(P)-dependent dehydrogenase (short-subunit alcohol dehydrogenase family)